MSFRFREDVVDLTTYPGYLMKCCRETREQCAVLSGYPCWHLKRLRI